MSTTRFLVTLLISVALAAAALALAEILDAPWLRVVALALLVGAIVAREIWTWRGEGRSFPIVVGLVLTVLVFAFVIERLA